jgi:hypothetical protein
VSIAPTADAANGRVGHAEDDLMIRFSSPRILGLVWLLPSLVAAAGQITAEQAKAAAIDGMRKNHSNPDLFDASLLSDAPLSYGELLGRTAHTDVFKLKKWKARLARRTFWVVQFAVPQDPGLITAGSGAWVFVDALKGTVLGIRHWQ